MVWDFSLCVWLAPQIPKLLGADGGTSAGSIFLFIYIYIYYTYIYVYTDTQRWCSAHQYFSGLCCVHWLEEQFGLTWSFHLDSKEEALWTLVLLTQGSASWNWRCLLELKIPPGTTHRTFGNLDLPGGSHSWNLSFANIWGIKNLPSLHWIFYLGDGLPQI